MCSAESAVTLADSQSRRDRFPPGQMSAAEEPDRRGLRIDGRTSNHPWRDIDMALPNRSLKTFALLAAVMAVMGVAATGCGTEDDAKSGDEKTEEPADEATDTTEDGSGDEAADEGEEPAEDEAASDEDA
jgi:hypothetical protein